MKVWVLFLRYSPCSARVFIKKFLSKEDAEDFLNKNRDNLDDVYGGGYGGNPYYEIECLEVNENA